MLARRQDSVTGGEGQKWILEGTRSLIMWIRECGSNEKGEDQNKNKAFSSKISTNSGFHLKILAIFHES